MAATSYERPTGWTGWIAFAAVMLIIVGIMQAFYGLIAVVNDTWVGWNPVTANAVLLDISAWGFIHMLVGLVLFLSGLGLLAGNMLARIVGVFVAGLSMLVNFFWLPVSPLWSLTVITISVLVIWALIVHGKEMKSI
jgi:hypothetical protein